LKEAYEDNEEWVDTWKANVAIHTERIKELEQSLAYAKNNEERAKIEKDIKSAWESKEKGESNLSEKQAEAAKLKKQIAALA
jgi:predicted  nucleic acid-binding Zn-ribbon protein